MQYHVIISLDKDKRRRVGDIIKTLEQKGMEFLYHEKKTASFKEINLPDFEQFIIQNLFTECEFVGFYRKFDPQALEKEFNYFLRNHVELIFESKEKIFDPDDLWKSCKENFENDIPIMIVVPDNDTNGGIKPFILF